MKLLTAAILSLVVFVTACGDDGKDGAQGQQGVAGQNGQPGQDGKDGSTVIQTCTDIVVCGGYKFKKLHHGKWIYKGCKFSVETNCTVKEIQ